MPAGYASEAAVLGRRPSAGDPDRADAGRGRRRAHGRVDGHLGSDAGASRGARDRHGECLPGSARSGVRRLVHLSSAITYTPTGGTPIEEDFRRSRCTSRMR